MKETNIMALVLRAASRLACRLFRNQAGVSYQGRVVSKTPQLITLADYRVLKSGLVNGASDCIGWTSHTIRPEDVGKKVAIFTAAEVKTALGQPEDDQVKFIGNVIRAGGIAGVVRSEEDTHKLLTSWPLI